MFGPCLPSLTGWYTVGEVGVVVVAGDGGAGHGGGCLEKIVLIKF